MGRGEESQHAIPVHLFPKHVLDLHLNGEVGFAKEYEEIRAASCLGNDIYKHKCNGPTGLRLNCIQCRLFFSIRCGTYDVVAYVTQSLVMASLGLDELEKLGI